MSQPSCSRHKNFSTGDVMNRKTFLNRLTRTTDPFGNVSTIYYDAVGNRASTDWAVVPQYKGLPTSRIELDDRFMKRILPRCRLHPVTW